MLSPSNHPRKKRCTPLKRLLATAIVILISTAALNSETTQLVKLSELIQKDIKIADLASYLGYTEYQLNIIAPTGSMRPALQHYDFVIIDHAPWRDLKLGDIVVKQVNDFAICHRIVAKNKPGFYTKGDANYGRDPSSLTPENYLGKVVLRIRNDIGCSEAAVSKASVYLLAQGRFYNHNAVGRLGTYHHMLGANIESASTPRHERTRLTQSKQ